MKKISALLLVLLPLIAFSQNNFKAIDSVLSVYDQGVVPGVSVSIAKNGKVIYSRNVGYADIEANKKIDDKTLFCMASVSKQFTAACIVMLEQQGKLSLEDKLSKYFPDFPEYANTISIVHLLNHTSGVKDYRALAMLKGEDFIEYTNDDANKLLKKQELNFKPGKKFSYTNSGYWLLVQIVEKVSGESIIDFAEKNIFYPLKMQATSYAYDSYVVNEVARGYAEEEGVFKVAQVDRNIIAGAGVISNVSDIQKWLYEMETKKVFGEAFWKKMFDEDLYEIAKDYFYGKGLFIDTYGSTKRIQHGGDVKGFHTLVEYFPGDKVTAVILTNNDSTDVIQVNRALVNEILGYRYKRSGIKKTHEDSFLVLSESDLKKYEGYYNSDMGASFDIRIKEGKLYVVQQWDNQEFSVLPIATNRFKIRGEDIYFSFSVNENKVIDGLSVEQDGGEYIFKKSSERRGFDEYTGVYYSEALAVNYEFSIDNNNLVFRVAEDTAINVVIINNEGEGKCQWGTLIFKKDKKGLVKGFSFFHERAQDIEFIKIAATE